MKKYKNYVKNQALRRNDPFIRKIRGGKVVTRYAEPEAERSYAEEANAAGDGCRG